MKAKLLTCVLLAILLSSNNAFSLESNKPIKEPDFLDKATQLTNKIISGSTKVAKDVIDKTTDLTNKVLSPKDKKNCSCNSKVSKPIQ